MTAAAAGRVISFEGVLDVERAGVMLELVQGGPAGEVVLDFRGAREIHDAAIGLILRTMEHRGWHLRFRGLKTHHEKLLEMLRA